MANMYKVIEYLKIERSEARDELVDKFGAGAVNRAEMQPDVETGVHNGIRYLALREDERGYTGHGSPTPKRGRASDFDFGGGY